MDMRHAEIAGQPKGDVAVGQLLYADNCAMCHGENGELAVETAAGEGIVINSAEYLSQQDDAAVIVKIAVGVPGRMPAYGPDDGGPLSWAEVRSVAAFMRSWAPQAIPVPSPAPTGGDVAQGATLYADNCAACHGSEGQGGAVASQPINSPKYLAGVTDDGLDQVVRNGTAGMPSFGSRLSDEEIAALIAFMRSWANPPV
jgi:cytochrome c oxidase cbb3-type subunit 3